MIPRVWLNEAEKRLASYIYHTPLSYYPDDQLFIKWENHQVTGSFKIRGAFNKVLSLEGWEREKGLVTASAGNHGQGVALAGKTIGTTVIVFASDHAILAKIEAMRALGAEVRLVEGGYGEAEAAGLAFARENGSTWISPYNDGKVISGQGTLGLEIIKDLPPNLPTTWVVPAGGGGLVSGIGTSIQDYRPKPRLVAVQSVASSFLYELYYRNSQEGVIELSSLADGLAGPVENDSLTIPMVKKYVDEFILVTEGEIARAINHAWYKYRERIEGSAAVALAAVLYGKVNFQPAVVIISGGNIEEAIFNQIVGVR